MPRIRMLRNFVFHFNARALASYEAGKKYNVTTPCAEAAVASGAAVALPTPPRRTTARTVTNAKR